MKRPPAPPPELPGLRPLQHLGSGGFADVYLYEQELPRRRVAVKVLISELVSDDVRRRFVGEANAMARLSAHPSIVTIFQAGVAPDGRPYLVMEFCPRPNLAVRFRREKIPLAEALRIGVRLANAVQTAHEAGILHRDIKPANVLVTEFGWPALTDFGIAAQLDAVSDEAEGMSVPWSAPELFGAVPRADKRTDVYALGATVYALVAGRSPFERPGDNSTPSLIHRIERNPVPPTGRADVPPQLEQVLARSLHKRSEARHRSALEFAQALQGVEVSLGLPPTDIDVRPDLVEDVSDAEDDATRLRGVTTIDDDSTRLQYASGTSGQAALGVPLQDQPPRGSRVGLAIGLLVLVLVAGVIAGILVFGPDADTGANPTPSAARQTEVGSAAVTPDPPSGLECEQKSRTISCTWDGPAGGDLLYQWRFQERPEDVRTVDKRSLSAAVPAGVSPCVSVTTVGGDGRVSAPVTKCAG